MSALSYSQVMDANERTMVGYIGLGNRGGQVHDGFLEYGDARTAAICDLKTSYLDLAEKKAKDRGHDTPKRYADWRKLIEDKTLDAVVIATPGHWHALMRVEAAERNKRVVQVGIHRRSAKFLQEAAAYVQSGALGWHLTNEWPTGLGSAPEGPPPGEAEWDA